MKSVIVQSEPLKMVKGSIHFYILHVCVFQQFNHEIFMAADIQILQKVTFLNILTKGIVGDFTTWQLSFLRSPKQHLLHMLSRNAVCEPLFLKALALLSLLGAVGEGSSKLIVTYLLAVNLILIIIYTTDAMLFY